MHALFDFDKFDQKAKRKNEDQEQTGQFTALLKRLAAMPRK